MRGSIYVRGNIYAITRQFFCLIRSNKFQSGLISFNHVKQGLIRVCSLWHKTVELNWTELNWTELNWTELKRIVICESKSIVKSWTELIWSELNWSELNWTELNWTELNWTELNWTENKLGRTGPKFQSRLIRSNKFQLGQIRYNKFQ